MSAKHNPKEYTPLLCSNVRLLENICALDICYDTRHSSRPPVPRDHALCQPPAAQWGVLSLHRGSGPGLQVTMSSDWLRMTVMLTSHWSGSCTSPGGGPWPPGTLCTTWWSSGARPPSPASRSTSGTAAVVWPRPGWRAQAQLVPAQRPRRSVINMKKHINWIQTNNNRCHKGNYSKHITYKLTAGLCIWPVCQL